MSEMDRTFDFIDYLEIDVSLKILSQLDDPSDLVRVCSVSRLWRRFVIEHNLSKQLCLKKFPDISSAAQGIEANGMIEPVNVGLGYSAEWECLKRKHKVYSFLAKGLSPTMREDCLFKAISASSTDNFPTESVEHTLEESDTVEHRYSYWSSEGKNDTAIPETLLYNLVANLCFITEIRIHPFQAYFQVGFPIYSSKAIRFRIGHLRNVAELTNDFPFHSVSHQLDDDRFIWTYTSPEFPMAQQNSLQKFELPEPVLCFGGLLLVELLGRVQIQQADGLYYICISHVQVAGRPLSPAFDLELLDPQGKWGLKYQPRTESSVNSPNEEVSSDRGLRHSAVAGDKESQEPL